MKHLWLMAAFSLLWSMNAWAGERAPSLGVALSWMELENFQPALPTLTISQRVLLLSVRGETQIETGVALRLAAGWGFAFEGPPLGIAHYETALALNFPVGGASASIELGSGVLHLTQNAEQAWRLTGWVGAGGRFSLVSKISVFFDVVPLVLLDFSRQNLPWVWSYRGGVLWRF